MRAARGGNSNASTTDKTEDAVSDASGKVTMDGQGKGSVPVREARVFVEFVRSRLFTLLDSGD